MNEHLKNSMEAELAPYYQIQDDRWRRYYECQDDSIVGGISWQVTSDTISQIKRKYHLWQEQEDNGGLLSHAIIQTCLMDLEGNLLSDRIVSTKYGQAFLISRNGGVEWVSVAKKKDTYLKKGFTLQNRVRVYSMSFSGRFTQKGSPVYLGIQIQSEEWSEWNSSEDIYNSNGDWVEYCHQNPL